MFSKILGRSLTAAVATATAAGLILVPTANAAIDGSNVVISEVYGGGGNSGAVYTHDFIELYNPTDEPISLDGWSVEYFSATGGSGGTTPLTGTIEPGGYYLVQQAQGNGGSASLPTPDATGNIAMAGSAGRVALHDTSTTVDFVGYGNNAVDYEGSGPTGNLSATNSAQRSPVDLDTDDNATDFIVGPADPQSSGHGLVDPEDPGNPVDPVEPGAIVPIADIQGTGASTPLNGRTVSTEGIVTGVYQDGGRNGFSIQTPGTGSDLQNVDDASHGIFVYLGNSGTYPAINDSVTVTGQAGEHFEVTQLSNASVVIEAEDFDPVTPVEIEHLPAGDEAREPYESMLVQPTGDYTVSNNYQLNTFGELGLAPGPDAFLQATEVHSPDSDRNSPVQQLMAQQVAEEVLLDDGRTPNYMNNAKDVPIPYIAQDNGNTIKSIRTGDAVNFHNPVIVDYSHDFWRFQPTTPVTGNTAGADLPITWEDSRAAELNAMAAVEGAYSVSTFNVLNYFTSLGKDNGCSSYKDMHGNPVAASGGCDVRGAYTESAFDDQQTKIVNAINLLDSSVVGLEEIENTYAVTGNIRDRDEALSTLVDALNEAAGSEKWDFVPSPAKVGTDEDVIRVAFIYQPAEVTPVDESRIFDDQRFTRTARQPLAQEFTSATDEDTASFVAIVNHFKSKGSVTSGDADQGDGQGNNPNVRNRQSEALLEHLGDQDDWSGKPVFILGDINSYSKETAMATLETAGFTNIVSAYDAGETYQFSGRLGSLDHALGNQAAMDMIVDADVWDINADEPIAFEYSRRNYNVIDFHDDSPFRSSDHDPIKVGFNLGESETPGEDVGTGSDIESFVINADGELIITFTNGDTENLGTVVGQDGTDGDDGRGIESMEINADGDLIVTYTDQTTENLGNVNKVDEDDTPAPSGSSSGLFESLAGFGIVGKFVAQFLQLIIPANFTSTLDNLFARSS